jgi:uncharacterized damage-inducible protein DinB
MRTPADLTELVRHMEWGDAIVWQAVFQSAPALADRRSLLWLYHIHMVQRAFTQVWRREEPRFRDPSEFPEPHQLAAWGREGHQLLQAYVTTVAATDLGAEIPVPWAGEIAQTLGRDIQSPTLGQTITQVAMHSVHHRAQINARLRELGAEPPIVDFIAWIWWGQPEAAWTVPA